MDIEKFFDSMNHEKLVQMLETCIGDPHFLRLIRRMLRTQILRTDGTTIGTELGTPQGSPVSPILANIYLHFLRDTWFRETYARVGRMIRYADDAVFIFDDANVAQEFRSALEQRLAEGELRLNLDKSCIVPFNRRDPKGTVSFLGFEFYWGRSAQRKRLLKVKTMNKRLHRSIQAFKEWIKANRNRTKLDNLWRIARAKIQGHFNYFGVVYNQAKLRHFYETCCNSLFKWLNRRSQRRSMTWQRFKKRLLFSPLPLPPLSENLKDISSELRSLKHKPKSRMRETRKSGSVRSSGWQHPVFT